MVPGRVVQLEPMAGGAFITGISGFIGRALAARLKERGLAVAGLAHSPAEVPGCRVVPGEVVHPASYSTEVARARYVVHLAAPTTAGLINANPLETLKVNWRGTCHVLDCFRGGEGEHFVFLSSGKVYGTPESLPIPENHRLAPTTVLGKAKKAAEDLLSFYADYSETKRFTILRIFNAYGPGQKPDFLIPTVLRQLEKPEIELGDTASRRDFVYLDDVVDAITTVLFNPRDPDAGDARLRIFNVGSGSSHSPAEIVDLLGTIVGRELRVTVDRQRLRSGEADEERADVRRLTALGWQPRVELKSGLELTWRAFNAVRA